MKKRIFIIGSVVFLIASMLFVCFSILHKPLPMQAHKAKKQNAA